MAVVVIALLVSIVLSVSIGQVNIPFVESYRILFTKLTGLGTLSTNGSNVSIIWEIRCPRILMAALIGAGLALCGSVMQATVKNPLADPYILGISSGAALGAAFAIVIKLPSAVTSLSIVTIFAFIGAIITTILVYYIAQVKGKVTTINLLLGGSAINFLMSAIISIIMVFNQQDVNQIVFWMMGSFNASSWKNILIVAPVILIGTVVIYFFYRDFNLMLIGEDSAKSLGVETEKLKKLIIIISSMIIGVCVAFSGVIGFVGFLVPHMVRIIFGPNNKALIPFSALAGATFLLLADTVARTIASPAELPVGAVTALIGSPYFIYLLVKMKKRSI
jgi:iron complex transport system permease protein